jgi:hypothetical protein
MSDKYTAYQCICGGLDFEVLMLEQKIEAFDCVRCRTTYGIDGVEINLGERDE